MFVCVRACNEHLILNYFHLDIRLPILYVKLGPLPLPTRNKLPMQNEKRVILKKENTFVVNSFEAKMSFHSNLAKRALQ